MFKVTLLTVLISAIILVEVSSLDLYKRDFDDVDIFQVIKPFDTYEHIRGKEIQKLNDLLVDRTNSANPYENLDIILEELIIELKNRVPYESESVQAKRLILTLRTIQEGNLCSYYTVRVLVKSLWEMRTRVDNIYNDEKLRRVDKILAHFIKEHLNKCQDAYLKNFDRIVSNGDLDTVLMNRLNVILKEPIKFVTSEERPENKNKAYIERINDLVSTRFGIRINRATPYVYNAMKELVKGDPNEKFIRPVEDEKKGRCGIREDEFEKLFNEYVAKPCKYIKEKFGPDIFEPVQFRRIFDGRIFHSHRVDFYETWLKYRLCFWDLFGGSYHNTFYYVESYFAKLETESKDIKTVHQ